MVMKSKGPRPKKGRLGKKKRRLVEAHTLAHLRGGHDYSYSHTRTREIDARVAGAGVLGARIKAPRHHGVTVPAVPVIPRAAPPKASKHGRHLKTILLMPSSAWQIMQLWLSKCIRTTCHVTSLMSCTSRSFLIFKGHNYISSMCKSMPSLTLEMSLGIVLPDQQQCIIQISFFLLERQFNVCHVIQRVIHLEM